MRHLVSSAIVVSSIVIIATLPAAAAAQQPQPVAMLTQIRGDVLVDTGEGFVPVSEDVSLALGDRVMVTDAGQAVLSYGGDCSFPLQSPSMTTVEETACAASTQGGQGNGSLLLGVTGFSVLGNFAAAGFALAGDDEETPVSP
jgi:hypothetical protein